MKTHGRAKRNLIVGACIGAVLTLGAAGCTATGEKVLPSELEARVVGQPTAEDYLQAAQLYAQRAEQLQERADKVETRADALAAKPYLDPKGLKRSSLERLAGTYRSEAQDMQELHAAYRTKAESMFTQQQQQR